MADYKRMYTLLCKTIDDVIDPLSRISDAKIYASYLQNQNVIDACAPRKE